MGRGNFCLSNRQEEYGSSMVYVINPEYDPDDDQFEIDLLFDDHYKNLIADIRSVLSKSFYPENDKRDGRSLRIIAQSELINVAIADNEYSTAVCVYARDEDYWWGRNTRGLAAPHIERIGKKIRATLLKYGYELHVRTSPYTSAKLLPIT
jgi:hypothetical protein